MGITFQMLNRAGFGAAPEEVETLVKQGFDEAVHRIVYYENIPDPLGPPAWLNQPLDLPGLPVGAELQRPKNAPKANPPGAAPPNRAPGAANQASPDREQLRRARQALMRGNRLRIEELRAWWLDRMVRTPRPLEEKMTLFWHGHFATQAIKARIPQLGARYSLLDCIERAGI